MSAVFLDLDQIDVTAHALGKHAAEVESIASEIEVVGAVPVPPSIAGWLASEVADIAATVRMAALVYLVAVVDAVTRAEALRTNQSLVTALPDAGAVTPGLAETGFSLAGTMTTSYAPVTGGATGTGFYLGDPGVPTPEYNDLLQRGILHLPSPHTSLGGYTPSTSRSFSFGILDTPGTYENRLWTLSDEDSSTTFVRPGVYERGGRQADWSSLPPSDEE